MLDVRRASFSHRVSLSEMSRFEISSLVYGSELDEERSSAVLDAFPDVFLHALRLDSESSDSRVTVGTSGSSFGLYEASEVDEFVSGLTGLVALDITGLEHRMWAPIVRSLVESAREFYVLYAEPDDYQKATEPLPGAIYDLSSSIRGIDPLPGFAQLARRTGDKGYFAPLLGFEGARLAHILDQEEVDVRRTFPIVGFPGFRPEYPAYAFLGNRDVLCTDYMFKRVELADASCPFDAFCALERVLDRAAGTHLRVAPIGTKPHALGAVLFAIAHPEEVELIYDHPVRSENRTMGTRAFHVYDVGVFMRAQLSVS